jgi:hypothetical protein
MYIHRNLWDVFDERSRRSGISSVPPGRLGTSRPSNAEVEKVYQTGRYLNALAALAAIFGASYVVEKDLGGHESTQDIAAVLSRNIDILSKFVDTTSLDNPYSLPLDSTFLDFTEQISTSQAMELDGTDRLCISDSSLNEDGLCPIRHVQESAALSERVEPVYRVLEEDYKITIPRPKPPYLHPANLYMTMAVVLGRDYEVVGRPRSLIARRHKPGVTSWLFFMDHRVLTSA